MNGRYAYIVLFVSICLAVRLDGKAAYGGQSGEDNVRGLDWEIMTEINDEQYHGFGNSIMLKSIMEQAEYNRMNNVSSRLQPAAPYNNRFGAGISVNGMGNGVGILPFFSRRINDRSYYQIRVGFTAMWHPYMRYREPNMYGNWDYGTTFLMPMLFSYKRYWGEGRPNKRVYPYFALGAGPVLGMSLPATGVPYDPVYSKFAMRIGPAAFAGIGLNIVMTRRYWLSLEGRYEAQYFPSSLGPRNNYSSPAVFVGISRGFYF